MNNEAWNKAKQMYIEGVDARYISEKFGISIGHLLRVMKTENWINKKAQSGIYEMYIMAQEGYKKVGISKNSKKRHSNIQVANPLEVTLYKVFLLNNKKEAIEIESIIHTELSDLSVRGEWFYDAEDIDERIIKMYDNYMLDKEIPTETKNKLEHETLRFTLEIDIDF